MANDSRRSKELQMPVQSKKTKPVVRTTPTPKQPSTRVNSAGSGGRKPSSGRPNGPKKKRPMSKKKKFTIVYVTLGLVLVLSLVALALPHILKLTSFETDKTFSDKDVESNFENQEAAAHMSGFLNIAVFGIDTRAKNEGGNTQIDDSDSRSDVIMIISVNRDTNQIKLCSVYRDTYLYVGSDKNGNISCDKINHAYAKGKAINAINALNRNLDLNITDYVTVDFSIVAQCIDAVGGIDVEILDREIERFNKNGSYRDPEPLINHYIDEINELTDSDSPHITEPGLQHLDGVQATAYARIRYCDTDYQRSERQRTVLMKMFEKAKSADIGTLLKIAETVAPQVVTSLTWSEIAEYAKYAITCEIADQKGFPFTMSSSNHLSGGNTWYNFADDLVKDVSELHNYLFGEVDYKPTSMVHTISDYIDKKRGKSSDDDDETYTYDGITHDSETRKDNQDEDEDEDDETYSTLEPNTNSSTNRSTSNPVTEVPTVTPVPATEVPTETPMPDPTTVAPTPTPNTPEPATETPTVTTHEPTQTTAVPVIDDDPDDDDDPNNV